MKPQKNIGWSLVIFGLIIVVSLLVIKFDLSKLDLFICKTVEADPNLSMDDCPVHNSSVSLIMSIALVVGIFVSVLGAYIIASKPDVAHFKSVKQKRDLSMLTTEERKLYDLLKKNQGTLYQSELVKQTQLSKVKITRLLDKMEGKKFIVRKRRGMTNIVILK